MNNTRRPGYSIWTYTNAENYLRTIQCASKPRPGLSPSYNERMVLEFSKELVAAGVAMNTKYALILAPEIGMGATNAVGSDSYPYEIVWVSKSKKQIKVRRMNHTLVSGNEQDGSAEYSYSSDVKAEEHLLRLTARGGWKPKEYRTLFWIGTARYRQDPSF
jgi:hypothetical protein